MRPFTQLTGLQVWTLKKKWVQQARHILQIHSVRHSERAAAHADASQQYGHIRGMQGLPAADSGPLPHLYQWADSLRSIVTQLGALSEPPAGSGVAPADVNTLQQQQQQLLLLHQAQNQGTGAVQQLSSYQRQPRV
jgi:hypothetical protein